MERLESDDWPHKMEQGCSGARDLGIIVAAFYRALISHGVPESDAGRITAAYTHTTLRRN